MKKLLAILLFIYGGPYMAFSQTYLTVGQIYNFNVGDVFETETGPLFNTSPPTYIITTVLGKWYSTNGDTVYYKDSAVSYTPPACPPPCSATYGDGVDTVFYTNLDSTAKQSLGPNECQMVWDTVYVDSGLSCWQKEWESGPYQSCLDTLPVITDVYPLSYSWLIEGCGGPYYTVNFGGDYPPEGGYYELIYAKKHDTICGIETVITGLNQINPQPLYSDIYPNPSNGKFTLACRSQLTSELQMTVEIYNVLGEKVYNFQYSAFPKGIPQYNFQLSVNLSSQPNGVYFYRVITENGELAGEGKLIIQK